VDELANLKSS
jgi:hypothetical protein